MQREYGFKEKQHHRKTLVRMPCNERAQSDSKVVNVTRHHYQYRSTGGGVIFDNLSAGDLWGQRKGTGPISYARGAWFGNGNSHIRKPMSKTMAHNWARNNMALRNQSNDFASGYEEAVWRIFYGCREYPLS